MICNKCGKEMPEGTVFCQNCGEKLDQAFSGETVRYAETSSGQLNKDPMYVGTNTNNANLKAKSEPTHGLTCFEEILLLLIAIGVCFLTISQYRQSHTTENMDSTNRLLVVEISNDLEGDQTSDYTQIENALKNGGSMRINLDYLDSQVESKLDYYAATNSKGQYWVLGALLNYISSQGWKFEQAPSSGLSDMYYFTK